MTLNDMREIAATAELLGISPFHAAGIKKGTVFSVKYLNPKFIFLREHPVVPSTGVFRILDTPSPPETYHFHFRDLVPEHSHEPTGNK